MKFTTLLTGLVAFTAIGVVGTAQAQTTRTWDGSASTDWNTAANWSGDNVPDSTSEIAVIPNNGGAGFTVNLDTNITCGALEIYELSSLNIAPTSSATLTINPSGSGNGVVKLRATVSNYGVINVGVASGSTSGVLRLLGTDTGLPHQIGGDIVLKDDASKLDIDNVDATFGPYSTFFGSVVGQHNSAMIEIDDGVIFTNQVTLEGMMVVGPEVEDENPFFVNDRASTDIGSGLVWANLAGTLKFDDDLILSDSSYFAGVTYLPLWKASANASAELEFNREADGSPDSALLGNFVLMDNADMEFVQSVTTTGHFAHNLGSTVTVAASETFSFGSGACASGSYVGSLTCTPQP
jgi:hypothetical protein